jgi:hypothetical protein
MRFTGWKLKALVLTVLALFVGTSLLPSKTGIIEKKTGNTSGTSGAYIQELTNSSYSFF